MKPINYDPGEFAALATFQEARRRIDIARPLMDYVGDEICRHGLHADVGLNMLHRHFDVGPNEMLVKRLLPDENVTLIEPRQIEGGPCVSPYLWRYRRGALGEWLLMPLEFVEDPQGVRLHHAQRILSRSEAIQDIGDALFRNGLDNVLGLVLAEDSVLTTDDEIQLEDSDGDAKRLKLSATPAEQLSSADISEVSWFFTPIENEALWCGSHCHAHCHNHCKKHCTGHCRSHQP